MEATFLIIGGGIAGISCAETLSYLEPDQKIILISESSLIKTAVNLQVLTKLLTTFDVQEKETSSLTESHPNIIVVSDRLTQVCNTENTVKTASGQNYSYKYLCICTGAYPKLIPQADMFRNYIVGIRDTDSVETFTKKLQIAKKVVIVGNGGIASEVIHKIRNVEVHWIIKDKHISATFVDPGAAEFFLSSIQEIKKDDPKPCKRMRFKIEDSKKSGAALGPDWYENLEIYGSSKATPRDIKIHYQTEISKIVMSEGNQYPIEVILINDEVIPCDLIISATGVLPATNFELSSDIKLSEDGGILVNEFMQSSVSNIYAAGDVCTANWQLAKHWFQMKLWTQARQMGCFAAKSMAAAFAREEIYQDFCFEMFTHSTKLFGYKVILLGLFNGQTLGTNYEILLRMTKGLEYIKFVLENNRLQGAVLIGDTDLEEMCENLILNQIDLSPFGEDILNPNIDIEDYFD
ncbi:pyridine nucleotide-disulfide oxidoreductase domain-containing protein 1 [Agrilus planipennis]|uniref:Pyridine nucleotide-disulfide oxidoreductase domain-containing protein 1 n=1 Tax=Agrilus planipennis TaxID=224129 RepID=A0A1W4WFL3_AGRPL|nr:pyridine nucleotide-disulfide oxidoreductase domain-containing protein 1 [Agrilus planipennis]